MRRHFVLLLAIATAIPVVAEAQGSARGGAGARSGGAATRRDSLRLPETLHQLPASTLWISSGGACGLAHFTTGFDYQGQLQQRAGQAATTARGSTPVPTQDARRYLAAMPQPMFSFDQALFAPDVVMLHADTLALTADQRKTITDALKALQTETIDLQWSIQAQQSSMIKLLGQHPVRESDAAAQMAKLLELENSMKVKHFTALLRVKNAMTQQQVDLLTTLSCRPRVRR